MGVYDGYSLQLLDEAGVVLANRSVSVKSRSERLEGLTSGKWYRVRVVTLSGGVPSLEATAEGQTRESRHQTSGQTSGLCLSRRLSLFNFSINQLVVCSIKCQKMMKNVTQSKPTPQIFS